MSEFRETARKVGLGLGWHWLLDLSEAARRPQPRPTIRVPDAGAGVALMPWWLADRGANVLSGDRGRRRGLPLNLRVRHRVAGWRNGGHGPWPTLRGRNHLSPRSPLRRPRYPEKLIDAWALVQAKRRSAPPFGTVHISQQDPAALRYVDDESMDAVVSISALEHNSLENLPSCVSELVRVLRPGGTLVATVGAAKERDWFHEPSKGWCLTEGTLRRVFGLPDDCPTNFAEYDAIFDAVRACDALKDHLAKWHFRFGEKWNSLDHLGPQVPVGRRREDEVTWRV